MTHRYFFISSHPAPLGGYHPNLHLLGFSHRRPLNSHPLCEPEIIMLKFTLCAKETRNGNLRDLPRVKAQQDLGGLRRLWDALGEGRACAGSLWDALGISERLWECPGKVWEALGKALDLLSTCSRPALDLISTCSRPALDLLSTCSRPALDLLSTCSRPALDLLSTCSRAALDLLSTCSRPSLDLL